MKYLLVMPKTAAKSSGGYNVFPVGIAYVSAMLKKQNFNVYTSNLEFHGGDTFEALTQLILENNIDVICTSGLSRDYYKVKEIINIARQINPNIITVIGGGIISSDPEPAIMSLDADIGVIGEGENTICELAYALDHNLSYANVPGLIYKNEQNRYIKTANRSEIEDIDAIPFPDYDGFSFSEYLKTINYKTVYVLASRSCPYSCTFCFHPSGKKYRQRSLDNLFIEIGFLLNTYNIKHLSISDELFAYKKERVIDFCQRIKPYNVAWTLQLRVTDVDVNMLQIMHDSGCICISYGIESTDNIILKSMKKQITVEQIEYALKITYDMNIDIQGGLIFGDIAETKDTMVNTLKWYDDHSYYALELNMIQIFPGTPLYNFACENGIIKNKIDYLKEGCPLVNVSKLTDSEYKNLSSLLYEKNMRSKYLPNIFSVTDIDLNGNCNIEMICNKCGSPTSFIANILHVQMQLCPQCRQRHYVDPFNYISHSQKLMSHYFEKDNCVALWGAGEICIKLLDNYDIFKNDKYKIVDISKSRQGYSVCSKKIFSPEIINEENIKTVIITVVKRKDEIINQLNIRFPSITKVYLPDIEKNGGNISLIFKNILK
ncbi:MAG: cobalamin-dependent protein [Ignavibacteria bacterium]